LDNVPKTLSGQAEGTGNREPQTYLGWTDPDLRLLYRHTRAMRGAAQGTVKLAYERAHGPMWTQDKATAIRYGADVTTIEGLYMDAVAQTHGITAEDMARIIDLGDRLSWASSSPEEETKGHLRFTMVTSRRADRGPSPTSAIGVPQSVQITPAAAPPPLVPSEMVIAAMDIPALRTAEANAAAWIEAWPTSASRSAMLVALRRMRDRLTTHDAAVMSAQDRLERIIADRAYHRLGEARSAVADLDARGSGHLVPDAWRGRLASTDPWILVGSATAGSVLLDLGTWGSAWFHRQRTGRWVQALEMRRPGSLADPIVKVTNVSDADLLIADIRRASGLAVHALSASTYEGAAGVLLPLLDPSDLDRIDPTTQRQGETPFTDHDPLVRLQVLDLLGGAPEAVVDPTRGWQRVQASAVEGWHGSGSLVTWEAGAALAVRLEVAWPPVDAPVP
jgi:hypothetical protein